MPGTEETFFNLPTDPDEFSVLLPPSELRKIDFSALEFATARRALVEYIKIYYPDDFNDFVSNNGVIMMLELMSYAVGVLSLRSDMLGGEGFLPTSQSEDAVINHLVLINQRIRRATPAIIDVECSVVNPVASDIRITAGQQFSIPGEDGSAIIYEIFRSPSDLTSDIVIPSEKRGIIAYGVEGRTETTAVTSSGVINQVVTINTTEDVIELPIRVEVVNGNITDEWNQIDNIEQAGANDKAYEVRFFDGRVEFVFGDNNTGESPVAGATINMTYRLGGGSRGMIGAAVINEQRAMTPDFPYTAPVIVSFRNVTPSSGGVDKESIEDAKKRAPRDAAAHDSVVTAADYAQLVATFSHPVFGTVAKAVATVRTSLNANRVELYILSEGTDGPVAPNQGLKRAVESYIEDLNVLTDHVVVLDAQIRAIDIEATVVISRSSDASVVKVNVDSAIDDFFALKNWEPGEALYISQLIDVISQVDGVKYVDLFEPADNILATGQVDGSSDGIDVNELITLGNKEIKYYYEVAR